MNKWHFISERKIPKDGNFFVETLCSQNHFSNEIMRIIFEVKKQIWTPVLGKKIKEHSGYLESIKEWDFLSNNFRLKHIAWIKSDNFEIDGLIKNNFRLWEEDKNNWSWINLRSINLNKIMSVNAFSKVLDDYKYKFDHILTDLIGEKLEDTHGVSTIDWWSLWFDDFFFFQFNWNGKKCINFKLKNPSIEEVMNTLIDKLG